MIVQRVVSDVRKHNTPQQYIHSLPQSVHTRLRHLAEHARLRDVRHLDEDVVCGVAVQRRAEALLVEVVADEANAAPEDEQAVERTNLHKQ